MKIAGISSTKAGDVNEGELKNRRQYQGAFSEYDEDIQWNDFALRNYDPQIARWVQQDPYQQFASPYVALGGDPVNMVDPSGGWSIAASLSSALGISKIGVAAVTTFVGAIAGAAATAGSGNAKGMIVGAFLGLASNFIGSGGSQAVLQAVVGTGKILLNNAVAMPTVAPPQATISNVGVTVNGARYASDNGYNGYEPLDKATFLNYVRTRLCPNCTPGTLQNMAGGEFEKLFDDFIDENFNADNVRVLKTNLNDKVPGELRNTVPDYFGIKYSLVDKKKVEVTTLYELESFYELKATKNNIGIGSFDGQLKVQIQAAKKLKIREIVIITTHGVKLTKKLTKYATDNGVVLTHYWAVYMLMPNGKMKLNFVPAKN